MKKSLQFIIVTFISICFLSTDANGQTGKRYLEPVFDNVAISAPVPLATNYTILPWLFAALQGQPGHTQRQPLVAQFYSPAGDTEKNRPLVIYIHTGNFFPFPQNGSCGGTLRDSSNVEIATRLAKMGYVVAVVNYRQGWNPFDPQELVRRFFLINAAYRGVQDISTYVRYFRQSATALSNPHGIDPDKITVWGQGTGGYLSLATAYLNTYSEILTTSDPLKFILPTQAGNIPMVLENYNGNVDGTGPVTTVDVTYNALSKLPVGDTLCVPNYPGVSSEFALCVNMGGALGDSTWLDKGEPPLISFHVPSDAFAPYGTDVLNVPTQVGPQPVVEVSGSYDLAVNADKIGLNDIFKTIPAGNDAYGDVKNSGFPGLCPFTGTPNDSSSPWEWQKAGLPAPTPQDCNTNAASSKTYIDTIIGYFAPRACVALDLKCEFTVGVKEINDLDVNLVFAPNPASDKVNVSVGKDSPLRNITISDISGRIIRSHKNVNSTYFEITKNDLRSGMYIVRMDFDKGVLTKKLLFN